MEKNKISEFLIEKPQGFLITGIGASAGGIQALQEFFQQVPADSGVAYVVILHLSPDHDSKLAQVLQAVTTIPVTQVTEKVKIEPNHIYVVPPNQHLIIEEDGFIAPSVNLHLEERRAPVDIFFRSLADSHGPRAICVVLSGTGANGSMGLKRIKEMGGVAYVQNPREAEFNEMPRNAIATELIDEVLPVAEIPGKILAYQKSLGTVEIPVEAEQRPEQQQKALREIFTQLRLRTGHDFTNYKRPTLLRRIERRINVRNLPDLPSYAAFIHQNIDEANALLKDLLISVTNFFRDKKPFEAIEQDILPAIFTHKTAQDEVRIWVAGCATGEEAYSLAMLAAERTLGVIDAPKVQIFATDIDEAAIAAAREGLYTLNDAADVSPERLRQFFNKEGDRYRVKREIREMILFANHNFLKDPPFSRLDLVTCRNVLIYLNATAQERVMETFHFALKPGGYLFLGTSESVDGASDLYATVSREHHIFQAREMSIRNYPVPESVPTFQPKQPPAKLTDTESRPTSRLSFGELHQKMLEQYAPPSLVVNEDYDILHMSEKVGSFLEFSGGEPSKNLLKLVKPELRLELRSALYQAIQRQIPVEAQNIPFSKNGEQQLINIQVRPVTKEDDTAKELMLVIFEQNQKEPNTEKIVLSSDEPVARQLEEELIQMKAQLRSSMEQHEYQAEELKASNEELQAMNEELRSAAEELETSKEELQSINEELRTVNQELKIKIEETTVTSNNLQNLINSADVATIFLDRAFCTRLYTPAALKIFNLIPADYGRPISDITHRLDYKDLLQDAEIVLEKLTFIEREVTTTDHQAFMMRVLPYRTTEDRINGVVITFFDVTQRKLAEIARQQSEERLRLIIESAKDYAIFTLDADRKVVSWSSGAQQILGYTEDEILGQSGDIIFVPEDRQANAPAEEAHTAAEEGRAENERWHLRQDGFRFWGSGMTHPLYDEDEKLIGFVKIMRDLTTQRRQEEAKFFLASIIETSNDSVITIDFQRNITSWNKAAENLYGYTAAEVIGKNLTMLTLPADFLGLLAKVDAVEHAREVVVFDTIRHTKDGQLIDLEIVMSPVLNTAGEVIGISTIARDVTSRKRHEANLAFLATINLGFAPLLSIQEVMEPVVEQLADYLQLDRCHFSLIDQEANRVEVVHEYRRDESLPSIKSVQHISDKFTEAGQRYLSAGQMVIMNTVADSPLPKGGANTLKDLGFGSLVYLPHLEGGRWRFLLTAGRAKASEWRSDELELLQELAAKLYIRIERAKAEEALHESEKRLHSIVNLVPDLLWDSEPDGSTNWYNQRWLEYTGQRFEQAIGWGWTDAIHPDDQEGSVKRYGTMVDGGKPLRQEHRIRRYDGTYRWFVVSALPLLGENGQVVKMYGAATDIHDRKQAEEELRESERRLRGMIDNLPGGAAFILDPELRYQLAGGEALHQAGFTEADFVGKTIWEAFPEQANHYVPNFQRALNGEPFSQEHQDHGRTFISRGIPLRNAAGEVYAALAVSYDITERKKTEEALQEARENLTIAVSAGQMGTWSIDLTSDFSEHRNFRHDQIFGYAEAQENWGQEIARRHILEEDVLVFDAAFARAFETGELDFEVRVNWPDQSLHWMACRGRFYFDDQGQPVRGAGVNYDITSHKKAEEQLRRFNELLERQVTERTLDLQQSRDLLQSVFDTTLLSLSILKAVRDESGQIIDFEIQLINKELERETGRTDLIGKRYTVEYPGIKPAGLFDLMLRVVGTGEPGQVEYYYPHENFNKWYAAMFVKMDDGLVASNLDITDRKLAEAELTRNFTILKQAEEVAGMGSWEYDYNTESFYWSEGMYHLFGLPVGSAKNPEIYLEYVIEEERPVAEKLVHTIRHDPRPVEETLRIRVNGKIITLQIKGVVLRDDLKRPYKLLCVDLNVSELKRLEQENLQMRLDQQKALLLAILEAQEEERRRISESLHNGVGQILYATKLNLDQVAQKIPKEIIQPTDKLLGEAIAETRRVSHELVPIILNDFGLEKAIQHLCQQYDQSSIQVNCELDLEGGRLASYLEIALYRISQELLNNVVKHAQATQADVLLEQEDGEITLKVRDNGQGMSQKSSNKKGIGLRSIADRVKLLNGTLAITKPKTGQGTQVTIKIPVNNIDEVMEPRLA